MLKFCPECGSKIVGGKFCSNCGADLTKYDMNNDDNDLIPCETNDEQKHAAVAKIEQRRRIEEFVCNGGVEKYMSARERYVEAEKKKDALLQICNISENDDGTYTIMGFKDENLTSITIPDCVTGIGWSSSGSPCYYLKRITIPHSVNWIASEAFSFFISLTNITVESGNTVYHSAGNCIIKTMDKTLVAGCKSSIIPADGSVTSIGDYAFEGHKRLTSITIPNGVTSIGNNAFSYCSGLTDVIIPNSMKSIGEFAFWHCDSLTSITIPQNCAYDLTAFPENCHVYKRF